MKKFLITVWFLVISILFVTAQDTLLVNGQITDIATGNGIPDHEVNIIIDSVFNGGSSYYYNTVLTDNNGYYNDNIPLGGVSQGMVEIGTYDCVMYYHNYFGYFNPNNMTITADFSICNDSIPNGCQAYFYYIRDSIDYLTYHFYDQSFNPAGGTPSSWYWEFGDGTSSTEQNPSHTYQDEGAYNVCLTITDSTNNCTDTYCNLLIITGNGCENFFVYTTNDFFTFDFEGYLVYSNYQQSTNYEWDFGDGTSGTGQFVTHTFVQAGTAFYTVCLTTTTLDSITNDTCVYTSCQDVYIGNSPGDCESYFDYTVQNLTVDFNGYTYSAYPTNYTWDFGDGNSGTGQNVIHTYSNAGYYFVSLLTEDSTGCIFESMQNIFIGDSSNFSNLYGTIFAGNNLADYGFVWLMSGDSLGFNYYFDFAEIDSAGMYHFYYVPPGDYYIQAMLSWQSVYFNYYLPTYYGDVLYWGDATIIQLGDPQNPYNINLIEFTFYNAGPGEINGTVTNEQGRGNVSDIKILLLSETYEPLSYINTDDEGNFDFNTLGYGTYVVYLELLGIETTPAVITISEENPSASIEIIIKNGEATISIDEHVSGYISDVSEVYPNPSNITANIHITAKKASQLKITIFNQMGQMVYNITEELNTGENKLTLNTNNLQNGIYSIVLTSSDGITSNKKLIVVR